MQISKNFYLYVVPAQVGGKWRLTRRLPEGAREYELEFEQRFQEVKGGARVAGGFLPAFEARLSGERIALRAHRRRRELSLRRTRRGQPDRRQRALGPRAEAGRRPWRAVRAGLKDGEE